MDLRRPLTTRNLGALLLALACAGCASSIPPPTDRLASSEAAARSAQELGATKDPQAALHLQLAKEQNQRARALMRDGDYDEADRLLQRSHADAELAIMLAKEASAKTEAAEAQEKVKKAKTAPKEANPSAPTTMPPTMPPKE
jgi:outer membrane PBP1 activator LpoA protein